MKRKTSTSSLSISAIVLLALVLAFPVTTHAEDDLGATPEEPIVVEAEGEADFRPDIIIGPVDDAPNIGPTRKLTEEELAAEAELLAAAEAQEQSESEQPIEDASEQEELALKGESVPDNAVELYEPALEAESNGGELSDDDMLSDESDEVLALGDESVDDSELVNDADSADDPDLIALLEEADSEPGAGDDAEAVDADASEAADTSDGQEGVVTLEETQDSEIENELEQKLEELGEGIPLEEDPLDAQAKAVKDYTYTVRPVLAPFNNLIYVKTSNPDPTSFRITDKQTRYLNQGEETSFVVLKTVYCDVAYENTATARVKDGYVFYDKNCKSDGGALAVQELVSGDTYKDTGKTVSCTALKDRYDYLIDTYTDSTMSFFDKLQAVDVALNDIAVYPRTLQDTNKPNPNHPYPFLGVSPYAEMSLNDHLGEMFLSSDSYLFISSAYPFVLDSYSLPSTVYNVAKRLGYTGAYVQGLEHSLVDITYGGETRTFGGAGQGESGPLFTDHVTVDFTFDGNASDLATNASVDQLMTRYLQYMSKADEFISVYKDQIAGAAFNEAIGTGTWIRVLKEGTSYAPEYAYIAEGPSGGTLTASNAWVDGRYVSKYEKVVPGEKFSDHPTAAIILQNVTYTDQYGDKHTNDVCYYYDRNTDTWRAAYYYWHAWYAPSGIELPDELVLTRDEVTALVPDRNTDTLPLSGLIYDGSVPPGTPFSGKAVTGVTMTQKTLTVRAGEQFYLTTKITPADAVHQFGTWSSSDTSVVYQSENGKDTRIRFRASKEGTAIITFKTADGGYTASCKVTVLPEAVDTIGSTVECEHEWTYTGEPVTPEPKITRDGKTLKKGVDYDITYENNIEIGNASFTVTGKGEYKGYFSEWFSIGPIDMSSVKVSPIANQPFSIDFKGPEPTVTYKGKTLKRGTDYTLSYWGGFTVGSASVVVKGMGNYFGSKTIEYEVVPADISKAKVSRIANQTYADSELEPKPIVTFEGETLTENLDYIIRYKNNVDAGTATVIIEGICSFGGTTKVTFKINKAKISSCSIDKIAVQTWKGVACKPDPKVTYKGTTLKKGTDYTLTYKNDNKVGTNTASVTITGKGCYTGSKTIKYSLRFRDVSTGYKFYDAIQDGANKGIVSGYAKGGKPTGYFGPNDTLKRCDVAIMFWHAAGSPKPGNGGKNFKDVKSGSYYYTAVRWAASAGVVNGYSGSKSGLFGPNDKVTRQQLYFMLQNYSKKLCGKSVNQANLVKQSGIPADKVKATRGESAYMTYTAYKLSR